MVQVRETPCNLALVGKGVSLENLLCGPQAWLDLDAWDL